MKFEGLLEIEGTVEGQIAAPMESRLILTQTGMFIGDIAGLTVAHIDGKVTGDVSVEYLTLGSHAVVHGDILCKTLEVDVKAVIIGEMSVSKKNVITSNFKGEKKSDPQSTTTSPQKSPQRNTNNHHENNDPLEEVSKIDLTNDLNSDEEPEDDEDKNTERDTPFRGYRNILVIHEPQVDFFSGGSSSEVGEKVAEFIESNLENIDEIYVTLDSHYKIHMSSRGFWTNSFNSQPEIDTRITAQDVESNTWLPRKRELKGYCLDVLRNQCRHHKTHDCVLIKQEHCSIGSQGSAILPVVNQALSAWVNASHRNVIYLSKDLSIEKVMNNTSTTSKGGSVSPVKEVVKGGVTLEGEVYDLSFLNQFGKDDKLLLCGQAASHCTHFSILNVVNTAVSRSKEGENEEEEEQQESGLSAKNVYILKDALATSADQVGIQTLASPSTTNSTDKPNQKTSKSKSDNARTSSVEAFWEAVKTSGVNISTTIEALL